MSLESRAFMWDHSSTKQVCHHQCSNKALRYPTPVSSLLLHLRSKDLWMQTMIMEQWTHEGTKLGTLSHSLIWWILFPHAHVCRLRAAFMWEITQEQSKCVTNMAMYIHEALTFPTPTPWILYCCISVARFMDAKNNLWNSVCMKVQSWELSLYIYTASIITV
jgi:hypothetical protein